MVRFGAGILAVLLTALVAAAQPALVRELGSNRFRYPGAITRLVTSPNGKYVAAIGSAEIWVYDFATGRPIWRSVGRDTCERSLNTAFTADGRLLTFDLDPDSDDGVVLRHYDLHSRLPVLSLKLSPNPDSIVRTAFSPDGTLLAVLGPKQVTLYDPTTGRELNRIADREEDRDGLSAAHFASDGRTLAVQRAGNTIRFFDRTTGRDLASLKTEESRSVSFSPDGGRLTVVQEDNAVVTLDVRTGTRKTWTPKQPYDRVLGLPNDQLLGVELSRMRFDILDAATGKVRRSFRGPPDLGEVSLTPDGKTVLVPGNDGGITLLDVATGRRLPQSADTGEFATLRFHGPDRLSGMNGHGWTQWNLTTGTQRKLPERASNYWSELSPDGTRLASVIGEREVRITDATSGKVFRRLKLPPNVDVVSLWFKDHGRQIGIEASQAVLIWDLATNRVRRVATPTNPNATAPVLTSSGRWFGAWNLPLTDASESAALRIFDLDGRQAPRDLNPTGENGGGGVRFTTDGIQLLRWSPNNQMELDANPSTSTIVEILDSATVRCRRRWVGGFDALLDISPDNRVVLTASLGDGALQPNRLRAVEVATGRVRWELPATHGWNTDSVGFAPDLRRVAVGTSDGVVRVWNADGDAAPPVPDVTAWDALLDADAAKAFAAVRALSAHPHVGLPLLAAKLPPESPLDAAAVAGWVRDLDAPAFRVRQVATKNLAAVAARARPALEAALAATPSPEARERLMDLLESLTRPRPADVRTIRAVEVVERILMDRATSSETRRTAVALLQTWAAGADGATLTTEAKETLNRVKK
jgi:WD40 repeat protein